MTTPIRTVALAGATGNLGPAILSQLLAANFTVTVFTRHNSTSNPTFPPAVTVHPVDYDSIDSLSTALKGQDALVSTLGSFAISVQTRLIDAALAAGVRRFIPSEFGSDTHNALARKLPLFADKVTIETYLAQKVEEHRDDAGGFSYTCIFNGPFLDWGLQVGLLLGREIYDGGDREFSTTRLSTIGKAVVGALKHEEETRNRNVHVHDAVVTQRLLARLGGKEGWEAGAEAVQTKDVEQEAYVELGKEEPDFEKAMYGFIKRAIWGEGYGGLFEKVDNGVLGIGMMSEEEIGALVRELVR